jgi:beta-N-acetylhexosaminidase
VKLLFDLLRVAALAALMPLAVGWRAPSLAHVRPWLFPALVLCALLALTFEVLVWRRPRGQSRVRRLPAIATVALALLLGGVTLWGEASFRWVRHRVMQADPLELETLGRHVIVGYRDVAEVRRLIERRAAAGIFLSGRNASGRSALEIGQEIGELQAIRARQGLPPLWVAADQEGGLVSRLSPPLSRTKSLAELMVIHSDPQDRIAAARELAATHGRELAAVGVNLNFAPVVDLNHHIINPNDRYSRIHQRAISSDPHLVAEIAGQYCAVLAEAGVHCTPKHFPGLGRVFEDTHREAADLTTPVGELAATDWIPFRALAQRADAFMMLGHARVTAIDPVRPVSFSEPVVARLLRGDWAFDGVLVSDDYCMQAVYGSPPGIAAAGIEALNAGVDLILIAFDPDQYYPVMHALLTAQSAGQLRPDALKRSDLRLRQAIRAGIPGNAAPLSP